MKAVTYSCMGQIMLVQGPPGTGKTFTLVSVLRCLVTLRERYNKGQFHEDVESILKDFQKEYVEVKGPDEGDPWNNKHYRKIISTKEKILVVATANVAVEAVMFCVIENWPGAKLLKICCASRDSRLVTTRAPDSGPQTFCSQSRCAFPDPKQVTPLGPQV